MKERTVHVGDVRLCYESLGDPRDPTVLLVMGLNLSMEWWRDDFCALLVHRGFHIVRFDNRDVGRSSRVPGRGITAWEFLTRRAHPAYTLGDMADDAAGLIAHVDPRGAHVVGASLGAMVAQEVAIRHPGLTRSLVSIMGRPGDGRTGRTSWRRTPDFLRPPAADPVEGMVAAFRRIGSVGRTAQDDEDVRVTVRRALARDPGPDGGGRQLAACVAERDRTADLRRLAVPALVVHGLRTA
jgi:pimeloyl-ACP methyl ester carboxylesterase